MCALEAGKRGRRVALLDHASNIGLKILISGGGRCNFTNTGAAPEAYVSENPDFCRSALSRFTPSDFIALVQAHGIAFHEKKLGQLFCDVTAQSIVDMLTEECRRAGVAFHLQTRIHGVRKEGHAFAIETDKGNYAAESVVVATGGLSLPKTGATSLGYEIASAFGLKIVPTAPALDGFVFDQALREQMQGLAGVSVEAVVSCRGAAFRENILFTHAGLSGPAALQASLYWGPDATVSIDLVPGTHMATWLLAKKRAKSRAEIKNLLAEHLPKSLAERFAALHGPRVALPLSQIADTDLQSLGRRLQQWTFVPAGTVGYAKAEVTRGGVSTGELSSKTMEANKVPGLYFIGEVVDVTGWLGGYNFQWAWASGWVAGQYA